MDKVSIVIPTYKRVEELKRALLSAINQTYKNIEIIVVDDNSNNKEIRSQVEELMKNYPNVKYIKNTRQNGVTQSDRYCLKSWNKISN